MAFYCASALNTGFTPSTTLNLQAPLAVDEGAALARLGGRFQPAFHPTACAPMGLEMQMTQLQLELISVLANLMLAGPGSLQITPDGAVRSRESARGLTGQTPPAPFSQSGGRTSFNIASFNVLGASHTAGGGNKPGMRDGVDRMRGAVDSMQKHNVDIAGMQEFQGPQQAAFKKLAPGYAMAAEKDNAIVWNKDKFKLVERRSVTIPYFEGHARQMPVVQLEDRQTGKRVWVVNIHNPADTKDHPHNAANRAKAISIEQHLMRELQSSGVPVMFVGDFNERNTVDNDMAQAGMNSARPNGARSEIDWILGSRGVNFSNYSADHSTQTSGVSDHPIIVSTATI
ncbi:endonuclease/exonuclease/phosphatase family protein [bacterium]|nr:endonuclease/exonuclease/phosphatase family protein [bacterium]